MKPFLIPFIALALANPGGAFTRETLPGPITAKMVRVVDGDTLAVSALVWPGQHIDVKVRLADIDAPELFRPHCSAERIRAVQAREFLVRKTGKHVTLHAIHLGKYAGRVIARVETGGGEDLSRLLLQAGLARPMADRTPWCPTNSF